MTGVHAAVGWHRPRAGDLDSTTGAAGPRGRDACLHRGRGRPPLV